MQYSVTIAAGNRLPLRACAAQSSLHQTFPNYGTWARIVAFGQCCREAAVPRLHACYRDMCSDTRKQRMCV